MQQLLNNGETNEEESSLQCRSTKGISLSYSVVMLSNGGLHCHMLVM